jgi:lactonase
LKASPLDVNNESVPSRPDHTRELAPIPYGERDLPTVIAAPYFKVSDEPLTLEGPAYDRDGNLLFVNIYGGQVLKLSRGGALSVVYEDPHLRPAGIAIHRDGRIFVAGVGDFKSGTVIALNPDGNERQIIVGPDQGVVPDDLVFDSHGGFYFTDFKGTATRPAGGVYYVTPDFTSVIPALPDMCGANGIALSPDEKVLWATEFCAGRLHRVDLVGSATPAPFGSTVPYHFIGRAPDSMRTDAEGNVYVAMNYQGRILVFSPYGIPIGQIVLPGRDQNHFLKSTSLAFVPGSSEVVIVSRDDIGGNGAMIFRAGALSHGTQLFSHQ